MLLGRRRILLTLCTGSGKTAVAFQVCWKLWSARWNRTGRVRRPKILFLADRNVLVDDPMAKDFSPFGDARAKISGAAVKSRDMYFAIYQAIARDEQRPGLYRDYPRDFFDLVIIDECHRGSALEGGNWREILEWFGPAVQIGMTATPRREDNVDTYDYFGDAIYQYSLAEGIADGFLAPYRVHRVITDYDATGWRPTKGELDRYGREIPDAEYHTRDFDRIVALQARTEAIAGHLTNFLRQTDRFAKTIVFCVDQEHALHMRRALAELNTDLVKEHPDYVCRGHRRRGRGRQLPPLPVPGRGDEDPYDPHHVAASHYRRRRAHLQERGAGPDCGLDAGVQGRSSGAGPGCGRTTASLRFNIVDYTGAATERFADPDFDGEPVEERQETIDDAEIVTRLEQRGIDLVALAEAAGQPEADPFDLLCHLAYLAPLRTRRERAERLHREERDFFERYGPEARQVLDALIEKYAEHGAAQFKLPEILEVTPFNEWGNVIEIAARFGGGEQLRGAVAELQRRLYVA